MSRKPRQPDPFRVTSTRAPRPDDRFPTDMAKIENGWLVVTPEDHCPNMFHHVWITDEWPLPTHPHCQWCGRPKPIER